MHGLRRTAKDADEQSSRAAKAHALELQAVEAGHRRELSEVRDALQRAEADHAAAAARRDKLFDEHKFKHEQRIVQMGVAHEERARGHDTALQHERAQTKSLEAEMERRQYHFKQETTALKAQLRREEQKSVAALKASAAEVHAMAALHATEMNKLRDALQRVETEQAGGAGR